MDELIQKLQCIACENPSGFTVTLPNLEPVKSGWIVALKETQNCFNVFGLRKALEVAQKTSKIIGGWLEDDKFYWDASMVYKNREDAIKAGIENEQIAIFNIETAELLYL
ncbi:MAG: hypothetical protein BGO31_14100 [Bacteroidetes bacterium 43-16]|nr:MAG: hypothetical protein BGO31_14100 [Bacteroidetes bacterium 43-16]